MAPFSVAYRPLLVLVLAIAWGLEALTSGLALASLRWWAVLPPRQTRLRRGIEPVTSLLQQKIELSASNPRLQKSLPPNRLCLGVVLLNPHKLKRPVLRRPAVLSSVMLPQSGAHVLAR